MFPRHTQLTTANHLKFGKSAYFGFFPVFGEVLIALQGGNSNDFWNPPFPPNGGTSKEEKLFDPGLRPPSPSRGEEKLAVCTKYPTRGEAGNTPRSLFEKTEFQTNLLLDEARKREEYWRNAREARRYLTDWATKYYSKLGRNWHLYRQIDIIKLSQEWGNFFQRKTKWQDTITEESSKETSIAETTTSACPKCAWLIPTAVCWV